MDKPAGRKLSWWPLLLAVGAIGVLVYAAIPETVPELSELIGKWRRPGEKYVLDVKSIGDDGRVSAAYFNPNPIKVESASAKRSDKGLLLRVVLRDKGYDGSTYSLRYDPEGGRLVGIYFLAGKGNEMQVSFERDTES